MWIFFLILFSLFLCVGCDIQVAGISAGAKLQVNPRSGQLALFFKKKIKPPTTLPSPLKYALSRKKAKAFLNLCQIYRYVESLNPDFSLFCAPQWA